MSEEEITLKTNRFKSFFITLGCAFFSHFLAYLSIKINETYGMMLFLGTPFIMGFLIGLINTHYRKQERFSPFTQTTNGVVLLGLFMLGFGLDGLICIILLWPLAFLSALPGTLTGIAIAKVIKGDKSAKTTIMLVLIISPLLISFEKAVKPIPPLREIITSVEVSAEINKVWDLVVEFPQIAPPEELMFKAGISYPIDAKIAGEGIGAIRYCNFSTGSFIEPITNWQKPTLLEFDVKEAPLPMKETSIYANLDTPHLHNIVRSEKGQFRLVKLPSGKILLEGTTWYRHDMWPNWYWGGISDEIIHSIHRRVLNHIKQCAENK